MTSGALRGGDIVLCERRDRRARHERELELEPIDRRVTAREVIGIWRKSRARNGRVVDAAGPLP